MSKVAIIGYGYVGKGMHKIFPDALLYDVQPNIIKAWSTREEINQCDLAIICVPTPMQESESEFKSVDTSIVESVLEWLTVPLVLIKSTVPPGTTDRLVEKYPKISFGFSPEYMGEGKYHTTPWKYLDPTDPTTHPFVIIGGEQSTAEKIANFFVRQLGPEKTYYLCSSTEAEIIKYMENSWGALKVIFAQEFYDLCQSVGASYIKVREGWSLDNRVEKMHTAVFVDERGFGGKCYPKDVNGIVVVGDNVGAEMTLLKAALRKNKHLTA